MPDPINIDFSHAATLLDVVQKVASVAPTYMALSSVAMGELKEMNIEAQNYLDQLGQERLKAEQDAAAKLAEHNRKQAEEQAATEREIAERTAASRLSPQPIMPGQPVPQQVQIAAGDVRPANEDRNADGIADQQQASVVDDTTIERRI